jgi:predicted RNA binding protein YcfA (HicA-like mRNA interferase family)
MKISEVIILLQQDGWTLKRVSGSLIRPRPDWGFRHAQHP